MSQAPLAARMRPEKLEDYAGQGHLLAENKPLRRAITSGQIHSMIFWGPPGVGKTTLAQLIAHHCDAHFITVSAVLAGVKDIRAAVEQAQREKQYGRSTILFIDEVHRFNKAQQDAFLPFVEDGTLIFIGATTENPSFEINNALLSRAQVYQLRALDEAAILGILQRAVSAQGWSAQLEQLQQLALQADGDGRRALNILEIAMDMAEDNILTEACLSAALSDYCRRFDKGGDLFYDQISALHKAVRGSSPDAALYWLTRMLEAGCDPVYVARRLLRMASEDIGNADPRALRVCIDAWDVQERLGSPEGELALAQAACYLACAPKSNAVYTAYKAVKQDIASGGSHEVPIHLRNAPTRLMKEQGYGAEYRYAHDEPNGFAAGENYFPEALQNRKYYHPVDRGLEKKIAEKISHLDTLNAQSPIQRYPRK
ncbi:replication-associated recombination protein A [Spongiibacter sp. KMU-158]|uniref:Replication-associated recombination protein A n=1 Tax=Spongiibacter pelagi TaxID=2760804 RepID=A0A927C0Z6_9GAMM|nr:replication-associated recombination protein A [Spongiibacter pelagi]MBD2859259.1 replication-associated recombination protein A [Spongiibacter pelagi]